MPNIINKQLFIVDTSIARPISFQIMRGETVQITCRFRDHLDPIVVAGMTATAYWHSSEMAPTSWYSSNAVTLESDKAIWNWVPDFGADGAKEYEWYIKVTDSATNISYRAFGSIQMVGSPDSDPGEAPEAQSNYYTKEETDEAIATAISEGTVTSVNGQSGEVTLTASDVGAVTQSQMNTAISTATQDLVHNDLEINGHSLTQDFDLTASDVEAIPESDRPTFERTHDYTYITFSTGETVSYDWSGTITTQTLQSAGIVRTSGSGSRWLKQPVDVRIGNKVTGIGQDAFCFSETLLTLDFGDSLQTIGGQAFFNDYKLTGVIFPRSITAIGQYAFSNCRAIKYAEFEGKTLEQIQAMDYYDEWGLVVPFTFASQTWSENTFVPKTRTINSKSLNANVTLTASDVGALPDTYVAPVTSVNSKTGAVVLNASDVGAATEEYVNEAVTQGTAIYRGSYATKAALNAVQWQTSDPEAANFVSNNDYAVVQADESQDGGCWRYIYVIDTAQSISRWEAQYEINESPLTQAQLDALNSTATKAKIDSIADKVPNTRKVNNKALSADVTLTANDLSALPATYHDVSDPYYDIPQVSRVAFPEDLEHGTVSLEASGIRRQVNDTTYSVDFPFGSGTLATTKNAHLNYVASQWTISPATYEGNPISIVGNDEDYTWTPYCNGESIGDPKGNEGSASLSWSAAQDEAVIDISATRTIYDGYRLGSQNTKILASQTQMTTHVSDKSIHTNAMSIAAEFDTTQSYAVGDYVMYQGSLYKCVVAHDAGAWDGQDFTAVHVTDEMGSGGGGGGGGGVVETTWSALKALRDGGQLSPGTTYRITDYVATTVQSSTQSANHPFDVLVTAIDASHLSEVASAALHTGDTYFANSDLEAWKIWYSLDNDTNKFEWADATNGKGVIYRMIDEFGNDIPYDFKGILIQDWYATSSYRYTCGNTSTDGSRSGGAYGNIMCPYFNNQYTLTKQRVNKIKVGTSGRNNYFGLGCHDIHIDEGVYAQGNHFDADCYDIRLRNFYSNYEAFQYNTFGVGCNSIRFNGYAHKNNVFGAGCYTMTLGSGNTNGGIERNVFLPGCNNITLGDYVKTCTFDSDCSQIKLGNNHKQVHFGANNKYINFGASSSSLSSRTYNNVTIEPGVQYVNLNCTASSGTYQNVTVAKGVLGTSSSYVTITDANVNQAYQTTFYNDTTGTLRKEEGGIYDTVGAINTILDTINGQSL